MSHRWPAWVDASSAAAQEALAAAATTQRYPAGATIFVEGDRAHTVLMIQDGEVKLTVSSSSGREMVLELLGPGEVIGELAALDHGTRSASVVALTEVEVLSLPSERFREITDAHPDVAKALLLEVIRRLRASDRRQLEFGNDAIGRVCGRLLELAERQDVDEIVLPVNQSELAAWAGLSREAVVKALASLRRLGWISSDGRRIRIHNLSELRTRASA